MKDIKAILWDYDGTLVDSTRKNMAVTVDVLRNFFPDIEDHLPEALTSVENYQKANYKYKNWRELYHECYFLADNQIDEAGKLWTPCQLNNSMIPDLFQGLENVILQLSAVKMGICSQNSSENIRNVLEYYHINDSFQAIIGYDDIPLQKQKPDPDGFLKCLEKLNVDISNGILIYIGDHSEDVTFGKNAEKLLKNNGVSVICIAVQYDNGHIGNWKTEPDYMIHKPEELLEVIRAL